LNFRFSYLLTVGDLYFAFVIFESFFFSILYRLLALPL